jgi:hypothetical protein
LICLIAISVTIYVTSDNVVANLYSLSRSNLPTRATVAALNNAVVSTHIKIFRYVSWASNSVSPKLLVELRKELDGDFLTIEKLFEQLKARPDLSAQTQSNLNILDAKLNAYADTAKDILDVGSVDAPMATMMLGQTDDNFIKISGDIRKFLAATTLASGSIIENLSNVVEIQNSLSRLY